MATNTCNKNLNTCTCFECRKQRNNIERRHRTMEELKANPPKKEAPQQFVLCGETVRRFDAWRFLI